MSYFRNKFNPEFLFLCNHQDKGASVQLNEQDPLFFIFEKQDTNTQSKQIKVIPLVLYNKIITTNQNDKIIEDYIVLCEAKSDTTISVIYDKNYISESRNDYSCNLGITTITGDLAGSD